MHGLMLRSIQGYLKDTFGADLWVSVARAARLPVTSFEPMLRYDPVLIDRVATAAARALDRPVEAVWEDLGTYLVTDPGYEAVRRLLRFGGVSYADFLHALEELPGRARLALRDVEMPDLALAEVGPGRFRLVCRFPVRGVALIILGMLRAMADDYGALVVISLDTAADEDVISVHLLDARHAEARPFNLAVAAG